MKKGSENSLKLSYIDHKEFLEYWNVTQKGQYVESQKRKKLE